MANSYSASRVHSDGFEVIQLVDSSHKTEVSIIPKIGNIAFSFKVNGKNALYFPFSSLKEFQAKPTLCGVPFLGPWANRLDQMAFFANGKKYALNPELGNIRTDGNQLPIHGLLSFSDLWEVTEAAADSGSAHVTSRLEFWKHPELMAQFPFAHSLEMTYRLKDGALEVETVLHNLSAEAMPVSIGYHPYFELHDSPRDAWKVHLAARQHVVLSPLLVPTGETRPVEFSDPLPLDGAKLDDVFTGLVRDGSGRSEFWVQGKAERISVVYGPKYPVAVAYAPPGKNFICFEPMAGLTNAMNLEHAGKYKELQRVSPGGEWRESFWIRVSGF